MRTAWTLVRFLAAWLWTLVIAAAACALLWAPQFAWTTLRKPWGYVALWLQGIKLDIHGEEHMRSPAVYVINHESLLDVVIFPAILPATLRFVAKKELGRIPLWGWALARIGAVMIDRKNPMGAIADIRESLRILPKGWSVGMFPEGTRSKDGTLGRFKKGAFHVAMELHLPVVPIGTTGARDIIPKGAWMCRSGTVHITIGAPIPTDTWTLHTIDDHVVQARGEVTACIEASRRRARGEPAKAEIGIARVGA